ncbi:MAG TPA: ABC transporter substrate-binding protein [Rhodopila sp.]|nr:ABC transporter substrate-binding protein [Rhodopila sp.]
MNDPTRRVFLTSTALVALPVLSAWAAPGAASGGTALDKPLLDLYAGLEAAMRAGRATPFTQRFDALAPAVDHAFDLMTILKVSVGLRWDSMDQGTQTRLLTVFRRFIIATYIANFDKYDGERFRVLPNARESGEDRIVKTEIVPQTGDSIRLDYVMRQEQNQWRAVDILLDGSISRVAVQRSDFRKILAGGDADALISSLRRKISDLSDGALSS